MTALDPDTRGVQRPEGTRPTVGRTRTEDVVTVTRTASPAREGDDTDAHLLRLCLDLQLDALLLTLGAAAAQRVRDDVTWVRGGAPPWQRWVDEDVELAASLAADALGGGAALPSTLGSDHRVPVTVVDDLVARYETMAEMLSDLLRRDAGRDGWRPRVRDALLRCRTRVTDLRAHRTPGGPPFGPAPDAPVGGGTRPVREHAYLPGELLG